MTAHRPPAAPRRRIWLMRHGDVDYFRPDGTPLPPDEVPLNAAGRAQADAAGQALAQAGARPDRAVCSGLPRTRETARRVLAQLALAELPLHEQPQLQEIRPGRLQDIPREDLVHAFTPVFDAKDADQAVEQHRFLGGERVGELLDRVLPAFDALLSDTGWSELLLVLHGGVNRALLGRVVTGRRAFLGRIEQAPGCINIVDVGANDLVLRAANLAPGGWLHPGDRATTMEKLLAQYLGPRSPRGPGVDPGTGPGSDSAEAGPQAS
jgi:probable phosphoglycerate mutase